MSIESGREAAQFAAIEKLLPYVEARGWSLSALADIAGPDSDLLFPGGAPDLVDAYLRLADQRMVAKAAPLLSNLKLSQRVRSLILVRLSQAEPERPAVRRAFAILALPANLGLAARTLSRTVEAIWTAAGDQSADFSWYTKRAILASVYSATLLYWLNEGSTAEAVEAFLDRRLAGVARVARLRRRLMREAA